MIRYGPKGVFVTAVMGLLAASAATAGDASDASGVRVVITGISADGRSVFVHDGAPGLEMRQTRQSYFGDIWDVPTAPETHQSGGPPGEYALAPTTPGAVKFRVAQLPPRSTRSHDEVVSAEHGMHQTDTIDFITIMRGEIWLELDDGSAKLLRAGDVVVQRGTNHAWVNRSDEPCTFSAVMVGAP